MPLGTEVHLGPGHIVLDVDPAPPRKRYNSLFSAHVYYGHGRTSQLLLSSLWPPYKIGQTIIFLCFNVFDGGIFNNHLTET